MGDSIGVLLAPYLPELLPLAKDGATASSATNNNLMQQAHLAPPVDSRCGLFAVVSIGGNDLMQNEADRDTRNGLRQAQAELSTKGYHKIHLLKVVRPENVPSKALEAAQRSGSGDPAAAADRKFRTLEDACVGDARASSSSCTVMDLTDIPYELAPDGLHLSRSSLPQVAAAVRHKAS